MHTIVVRRAWTSSLMILRDRMFTGRPLVQSRSSVLLLWIEWFFRFFKSKIGRAKFVIAPSLLIASFFVHGVGKGSIINITFMGWKLSLERIVKSNSSDFVWDCRNTSYTNKNNNDSATSTTSTNKKKQVVVSTATATVTTAMMTELTTTAATTATTTTKMSKSCPKKRPTQSKSKCNTINKGICYYPEWLALCIMQF